MRNDAAAAGSEGIAAFQHGNDAAFGVPDKAAVSSANMYCQMPFCDQRFSDYRRSSTDRIPADNPANGSLIEEHE